MRMVRRSSPMPPRVALLTPFAPPSVRGNAVTVDRIARHLRVERVAHVVDLRTGLLALPVQRVLPVVEGRIQLGRPRERLAIVRGSATAANSFIPAGSRLRAFG